MTLNINTGGDLTATNIVGGDQVQGDQWNLYGSHQPPSAWYKRLVRDSEQLEETDKIEIEEAADQYQTEISKGEQADKQTLWGTVKRVASKPDAILKIFLAGLPLPPGVGSVVEMGKIVQEEQAAQELETRLKRIEQQVRGQDVYGAFSLLRRPPLID